jgi:hypothetical protein
VMCVCKATLCHNPEDHSLNFNLCGDLKSDINCRAYSRESNGKSRVASVLN